MRRTIPLIATLTALLALAQPATSAADITDTIIRDCQRSQTGYLTGDYTRAQLRKALNNLPSDVLEYSGCYDQIKQALRDAAAGGPGGGAGGDGPGGTTGGGFGSPGGGDAGGLDGSGGGPAQVPPAAQHTGTKDPVPLSEGPSVKPGTIPAIGEDAHELPTPLIVLLLMLGVGGLALAVTTIGRRVLARRRA
jgi:hypothetical protein